ncbi:hypothetical protein [Salipiger sp.]|uniref:hypothetical protein n=1 Tax=Salipiger sp. TaxID=2078585 RepID=UPI003A972C7A
MPPDWVAALAARPGVTLATGPLPALPEAAGAAVLCNPVFCEELTALVRAARARGVAVTGAWDSPDFDLSLWAHGPMRFHPVAGQEALLSHIRALARALALCDRLLVTGPGMAGRLARRLPAVPRLALPFGLPAPLPRPAAAVPRRAAFLAAAPALRTALLPRFDSLLAALESLDAELAVCPDTLLPDSAAGHPRLLRRPVPPGPGAARAFFSGAGVALFPASGAGYWQRELPADTALAALAAGAACCGALPDQLLSDPPPGAVLVPASGDWQEPLARAFAPPAPLPALQQLRRWRWQRRHRPERVAARLHAALLAAPEAAA